MPVFAAASPYFIGKGRQLRWSINEIHSKMKTCPPASSSSKIPDEKVIIKFTWPYVCTSCIFPDYSQTLKNHPSVASLLGHPITIVHVLLMSVQYMHLIITLEYLVHRTMHTCCTLNGYVLGHSKKEKAILYNKWPYILPH